MKIACVGDFINHGKTLVPIGTSLVLLLSEFPEVEAIDVYCPILNTSAEPFIKPKKITIIESYAYDNPFSIVKLLKVRKRNYDRIIFNILPTAFGSSNLSNLTGLLVPLLLRIFYKKNNVEVIYHNSVYTNDISKLGYNSLWDKFRSFFLGVVEKALFKYVRTFVLLQLYKDRINQKIGKNKVRVLNGKYLEAIATTYMNGVLDHDHITIPERGQLPTILMHGSWGPQKNLKVGLNALYELRNRGFAFTLIITGGINHHFKEYEKEFNLLLNMYGDIINQYLGYINESEIIGLFTKADMLILPYNTPGGHSAVLEQALFFEVPTIAFDFPEYREQTERTSFVKLANSKKDLEEYIIDFLTNVRNRNSEIIIKEKLLHTLSNLKVLLSDS